MKNQYAPNEKEIIKQYDKKGYKSVYTLQNGQLLDMETKKSYSPNEIYIIAEHRFEGMSNPSDMSILFVLDTKDHSKGTVLANYGPANNTEMAEFFKGIPKENYKGNL